MPSDKRRAASREYMRKRRASQGEGVKEHGTVLGFQYGCRCEPCKEAKRADSRAFRARKKAAAPPKPPRVRPVRHGKATEAIVHRCRCDDCRAARARKARLDRERWNATLPAPNQWKHWTGPEMEIVATRADLTTRQLAAMLGRSYASVMAAKRRVRIDPRAARLAGASEQ